MIICVAFGLDSISLKKNDVPLTTMMLLGQRRTGSYTSHEDGHTKDATTKTQIAQCWTCVPRKERDTAISEIEKEQKGRRWKKQMEMLVGRSYMNHPGDTVSYANDDGKKKEREKKRRVERVV